MKGPLRITGTAGWCPGDVYHSAGHHGTLRNLVSAEIAGARFPGWIRTPG